MESSPLITADSIFTLTLEQLAWTCSVESAWVCGLVDEAILNPSGATPTDWRFNAEDLARARRAWRLYHELEVNLEGLGLILDMQDEIRRLHTRLDCA
ncbi:MAG: chaperone modulator CbpM [Sulfuriferula sp.]